MAGRTKGLWIALAAGAVAIAAQHAQAAGVPLLPHHAVYKLTLASSNGSKAPADASGTIVYDFSGSTCSGYKTEFRQVTALQPPEGESRVSSTETTTTESGDAATFDFDIRTKVNQGDPDAVKGMARHTNGGALNIAVAEPAAAKVDVPGAVLFPTEHLERIIATAQVGGHILSARVFDGSDTGQKIFNTLSVVGAPVTVPPAEAAAQDPALLAARRWPVTISYFEPGTSDAPPAYVLSFDLYENGVSRALRVDYGTFVLAGELVEFKPAARGDCSR